MDQLRAFYISGGGRTVKGRCRDLDLRAGRGQQIRSREEAAQQRGCPLQVIGHRPSRAFRIPCCHRLDDL